MGFLEIVTVVSGLLNVLGAVAGAFGWKRHRELRDKAEEVERAGEAVIHGVEACERILGTDEGKQVKRSVQTVARTVGAEPYLNQWLGELGLAERRDEKRRTE
ncbi:MAG: hypothetical protein R6V58_00560 [Planctomycetota bacterium]